MKKRVVVPAALILAGVSWYLFKPYDYLVTFKAPTFPGAIYQSIKTWDLSMDSTGITAQEGIMELTELLHFSDSVHRYTWNIIPVSDSMSIVKVYASDPDHSLMNKLTIPFGDTDFEKRTRKTLLDFDEKLREHIHKFKVRVTGRDTIGATYCACVAVKSNQYGKAGGMMRNYGLLSSVLVENGVRLNGRPFLEVTQWNMESDSIQFNFCYPVIRSDSLPSNPQLYYKEFPSTPVLKAVYNGNYITSDRAWYALLDYAKKNDIEVTGLPVEVFQNNPNMGGNELTWEADIYMPVIPVDE